MTRGLIKLTNMANTLQAREDWARLAAKAQQMGLSGEAARLAPPSDAGWRTIDKRIAKLRKAMEENDEQLIT